MLFAAAENKMKIDNGAKEALAPFERDGGENPYEIQKDLQELMQDNVGIVRTESEMQHALSQLQELKQRANRAGVTGHREFNPGWHTALDLKNLLTASEAITRAAIERKERPDCIYRVVHGWRLLARRGAPGADFDRSCDPLRPSRR